MSSGRKATSLDIDRSIVYILKSASCVIHTIQETLNPEKLIRCNCYAREQPVKFTGR